ncbi:MAG: class I tRNA ligase family protein, partial [Candidatus Saccharimonadales bacterium]
SCGPTVYDRAHIGNLASFIYADLLKRTLASNFPEAKIKHVMNLTDVDDKTIKRSQETYPDLEPMAALQKLTRHYERLFMEDLQSIGVNTTKIDFVRATDYISQMQELITELVASGIGYVTDDGVYFSIAKYKQSGKKYGQLVEITSESTGAARVNNDEYDKDTVHDFALWKKQKPGEPAWGFEIDGDDLTGRPGWHIECSAMSAAKLGRPFDIHTGGVDLKFPHHENEIAQSTAASAEKCLAKFFVHSEHILVDGQKMSKSSNNFYTLKNVIDKGYDPLAFRLLVLQADYHSQAHFSFENLEAAQNRLKRFGRWADRQFQPQAYDGNLTTALANAGLRQQIVEQVANDLDTPALLAAIEGVIERTEKKPLTSAHLDNFRTLLSLIDEVSGLKL